MNTIFENKLNRYSVIVNVKVNALTEGDAELTVCHILRQGNIDGVLAGVPKRERNMCADILKTTCKGAAKFPKEEYYED